MKAQAHGTNGASRNSVLGIAQVRKGSTMLKAMILNFFIECPRDPEVNTILSLTIQSLIVLRSHARHVGEEITSQTYFPSMFYRKKLIQLKRT